MVIGKFRPYYSTYHWFASRKTKRENLCFMKCC